MKEQLISFDTAKFAKEKGFNVYTEHMQTYFSHEMWDKYLYPNSDIGDFQYSETAKRTKDIGFALNENYSVPFYEPYYMCPTQSFLQKWLREVHAIHVFIAYRPNVKKWDSHAYDLNLNGLEYVKSRPNNIDQPVYDSYEEALEAGLVEALKLI